MKDFSQPVLKLINSSSFFSSAIPVFVNWKTIFLAKEDDYKSARWSIHIRSSPNGGLRKIYVFGV